MTGTRSRAVRPCCSMRNLIASTGSAGSGADWTPSAQRSSCASARSSRRGARLSIPPSNSCSITPISGFAALMCDGEDSRAIDIVFFIHDRIRKAVEVIDAKTMFAIWATSLILDEEVSYALVLRKKSEGDHFTGVRCVVHGCVAKLTLGVGVNRPAHAILALTRVKASSPGTMATLPLRTSSRRRRARLIHAFCASDFGSKLAISNSRIRARSSAGRSSTSAARSWAGVAIMPPNGCLGARMPQPRRYGGPRLCRHVRGLLGCHKSEPVLSRGFIESPVQPMTLCLMLATVDQALREP